jgi:hypothetical protein
MSATHTFGDPFRPRTRFNKVQIPIEKLKLYSFTVKDIFNSSLSSLSPKQAAVRVCSSRSSVSGENLMGQSMSVAFFLGPTQPP